MSKRDLLIMGTKTRIFYRMCSVTIECGLLLQNMFLTTGCAHTHAQRACSGWMGEWVGGRMDATAFNCILVPRTHTSSKDTSSKDTSSKDTSSKDTLSFAY